jgi:hypothetical protein
MTYRSHRGVESLHGGTLEHTGHSMLANSTGLCSICAICNRVTDFTIFSIQRLRYMRCLCLACSLQCDLSFMSSMTIGFGGFTPERSRNDPLTFFWIITSVVIGGLWLGTSGSFVGARVYHCYSSPSSEGHTADQTQGTGSTCTATKSGAGGTGNCAHLYSRTGFCIQTGSLLLENRIAKMLGCPCAHHLDIALRAIRGQGKHGGSLVFIGLLVLFVVSYTLLAACQMGRYGRSCYATFLHFYDDAIARRRHIYKLIAIQPSPRASTCPWRRTGTCSGY